MVQTLQTLSVEDNGVQLAYVDSGIPSPDSPFGSDYITLFAIHGFVFSAHVFEKLATVAKSSGVRLVAIMRRDYPGSTPIPPADVESISTGTDDDRAAYLRARGIEIAAFVDKFVETHNVPPPTASGKGGGFAILGWSMGSAFANAAVVNADALNEAAQARFSRYMRSLIYLDAPYVALGIPKAEKFWTPILDESIPLHLRVPFFANWITSYFAHGDFSTRDPDVVEYIVPSPTRVPSIYHMNDAQREAIVCGESTWTSEVPFMVFCEPQFYATYQRAAFDEAVRDRFPNMKVWALVGDCGASFAFTALFKMQEEDEACGGGNINFRIIKGGNHFMHWDDPEDTLKVILDTMA
ncbi:alpha/beta hydrolase [Phanerochaete sordida]|uniref:Alpha/beta hydrolase n=1 Tax=Phanerochaete sordida TaxID=48140 RepID=A0A9P3LM21_9APHY|nr:alpha/beta hydrolase [Phanerochaete sordida]